MKITDERKLREVRQKLVHPCGSPAIFFDACVTSMRRLVGDRVFDDVDVGVVPVAQKEAETFLLVNLDGGDEQRPERVRRNVDFH